MNFRKDLGWRLLAGLLCMGLAGVGCGGDDTDDRLPDHLRIGNAGGQAAGLLVDGQEASGVVNDRTFITTESQIEVGALQSASISNEVFAFASGRPPFHRATAWTSGADEFDVAFAQPIGIPVTVWIVRGPFATQSAHALEAKARTESIWREERLGLQFSSFELRDATTDPQAAAHQAFPNGDVGDVVWKPLRDDIGFVPGRVNIYWVDTVNGGLGNGWSNFGAQITMARATGDELLSHELGHAFGLTHVDSDPLFNVENVMNSRSSSRRYLTEGQVIRAFFDPQSALNALYNLRPGQMTRSCSYGSDTPPCPKISKRIWADGVFQPNGAPQPSSVDPAAAVHCSAGEHPALKLALAQGGQERAVALQVWRR